MSVLVHAYSSLANDIVKLLNNILSPLSKCKEITGKTAKVVYILYVELGGITKWRRYSFKILLTNITILSSQSIRF